MILKATPLILIAAKLIVVSIFKYGATNTGLSGVLKVNEGISDSAIVFKIALFACLGLILGIEIGVLFLGR